MPAKRNHQAWYFRVPSRFPYQHPPVFSTMYKRPYGITWSHYNATKNESDDATEATKIYQREVP
ncbi:MAG TPA: hypothetical protein VHS99_21975 [Chloroflexota bacterium]|nr:hypothetical protein [Chloroflexota bacterium]